MRKAKASNLNNLFAGGQQDSDGEGEGGVRDAEKAAFQSKLTTKQGKGKGKKNDRISSKDARVLTGGHTVADHAEMSRLQAKMLERSKAIKKGKGKTAAGTAHELTKQKVMDKLKRSRVAVSTDRINKK